MFSLQRSRSTRISSSDQFSVRFSFQNYFPYLHHSLQAIDDIVSSYIVHIELSEVSDAWRACNVTNLLKLLQRSELGGATFSKLNQFSVKSVLFTPQILNRLCYLSQLKVFHVSLDIIQEGSRSGTVNPILQPSDWPHHRYWPTSMAWALYRGGRFTLGTVGSHCFGIY